MLYVLRRVGQEPPESLRLGVQTQRIPTHSRIFVRALVCAFSSDRRARVPSSQQQGVLPVPARPPHPNTCPVVGLLSNPAKPRRAGHTKPHGTGILDLATTDATVVAPSPAPSIGSSEHPLGGATTLDTLTTHTRRRRAGDGAPQTRVQSKIHGNSEKELNEWLSEKITVNINFTSCSTGNF